MGNKSFGDLFDTVETDAEDISNEQLDENGGGTGGKKKKRQMRSLDLIADFDDDGFAVGWSFAVSTAFRDALDIKYTERKELVFKNGKPVYETKTTKTGKNTKRRKTRPVMRWTQGDEYGFAEGYSLYDDRKAYSPTWAESLQHFNHHIQIIRAIPKAWDENKGKALEGSVTFTLNRPNADRTGLERVGQYDMTQTGFVEYLRTGDLEANVIKDERGFDED